MNPSLWTTLIAVVGTLAAGLLTTVLKNRSDRTSRLDNRLFASQDSAVDALGDLLEALSNHYAAMWALEAARLRDDTDEIATALAASLSTRAAMTRPHLVAKLRIPSLADAMDAAVQATYAMDSATDATRSEEILTGRRLTARAGQDDLIRAATALLQQAGLGLSTKGMTAAID